MPSTVETARPSRSAGRARHDSTGSPSTSTVQVPHSPSSQPCLVPVRPRSSRRTSSRVLCTGTSTSWSSPLTLRTRRVFVETGDANDSLTMNNNLKILNPRVDCQGRAVPYAMPYFRTDDRVRLYYEDHGAGTPLVLAYGIGGNADLWDVNLPALAARHRVLLWEPRGHARSDSPEDPAKYSFARWTLDLRDLLDHLRLRTAHVGGLSLGAGIATRFTLGFPRRVRSLLVTNSSSASGLPLSVENLVMRARSIEVTLRD